MKLSDFKGVFKTRRLRFKRSYLGNGDQYVFEFYSDSLQWRPGEHGIFSMPDKSFGGKKWRAFSIASIPNEGIVRIATRIGDQPSEFKQALKSLSPGEKIKMRGPFGWFYRMDNTSPVVMVAGGVGITPIMSMIRQYQQDPTESEVNLIYVSSHEWLFKEELDAAMKENSKIKVTYLKGSDEVDLKLKSLVSRYGKSAYYFLSGAPRTTKALSDTIISSGISKKKIIIDSYLGY